MLRVITHMHPGRLRGAMTASAQDLEALASMSGLRRDLLDEALAERRRLGAAAMRALAAVLGVDWWTLRCDQATGQPQCPACEVANVLTGADLAEAARAVTQLLAEARAQAAHDVQLWRDLPGFPAARDALVAIGGEVDLDELAVIGGAHVAIGSAETADLMPAGVRLAAYFARGDADTDELVGLDIDIAGTVPPGLRIAGWDLVCYNERELDDFDVIIGAPNLRSWDRLAAASTWWLRRSAGIRPPVSGIVISGSEPQERAAAPLLALALIYPEPPGALSHAWASKGRGVTLSLMSRPLDYIVEDDGYVHAQYGPYRIEADRTAEWARHAEYVGSLAGHVFAASTDLSKRYVAAAEQFLGVAADLMHGWEPLPRLAVEMSTVAEMLLLSGQNEGEVSRSVRIAAGWLGGLDDPDREAIHDFAKTLYDAGSKYRHGGAAYKLHRGSPVPAAKRKLDVLRAYRLLQRLMLHGLAVAASGTPVAELCDQVQRTASAREHLDRIMSKLYSELGTAPQRFPGA
jgi:hypothetical protein